MKIIKPLIQNSLEEDRCRLYTSNSKSFKHELVNDQEKCELTIQKCQFLNALNLQRIQKDNQTQSQQYHVFTEKKFIEGVIDERDERMQQICENTEKTSKTDLVPSQEDANSLLDTLIKKKFTDIIESLDAEINNNTAQFRFTIPTNRLLYALDIGSVHELEDPSNTTHASSEINPETQLSSSRTQPENHFPSDKNQDSASQSNNYCLVSPSAQSKTSTNTLVVVERMENEI